MVTATFCAIAIASGDVDQPWPKEKYWDNQLIVGTRCVLLFQAGENWAILASLIETAKLSGIDPQAWLADILARLVNLWPNNRLNELLPWTWAAARQPQQRAA